VGGDGPQRLDEAVLEDADLGRGRELVVEPDVEPLTVAAAPVRAQLPGVLACALGGQPEAIDRCPDCMTSPRARLS
jgi:hypothetical protein